MIKPMHRTIQLIMAILYISLLWVGATVPLVSAGQGFYTVGQDVRTGMLVSLTKNPGVVEPASSNNDENLVGVVGTSPTDLSVQSGQVAVQTDGVVQALVSTIAGDISVGDRISPSAIVGLGAKAKGNGWVVGIAQGSLDATTNGAVKVTVTDVNGQPQEVYVSSIPVLVDVSNYSESQAQDQSLIPKSLQALADAIAGKRASPFAVILSFLLLVIGLGVGGILLNTTIRNGIKSIARQPLSKPDIVRQMLRSAALAVAILIAAVLGSMIIIRIL